MKCTTLTSLKVKPSPSALEYRQQNAMLLISDKILLSIPMQFLKFRIYRFMFSSVYTAVYHHQFIQLYVIISIYSCMLSSLYTALCFHQYIQLYIIISLYTTAKYLSISRMGSAGGKK